MLFAADDQAVSVEAQIERVAESEEGVTRKPLSALDAFEEIARVELPELQVRRNRRIEIGGNVERCLHPVPSGLPHK